MPPPRTSALSPHTPFNVATQLISRKPGFSLCVLDTAHAVSQADRMLSDVTLTPHMSPSMQPWARCWCVCKALFLFETHAALFCRGNLPYMTVVQEVTAPTNLQLRDSVTHTYVAGNTPCTLAALHQAKCRETDLLMLKIAL